MTTAPSGMPPRSTSPRWVDSPWAWLLLFGAAAVLGLLTIAPKYNRREARLERAYQARERAAYGTGRTPDAVDVVSEREPPAPRIVPWQTLAVVMVVVLCVIAGGLVWHRLRADAGCSGRQGGPA